MPVGCSVPVGTYISGWSRAMIRSSPMPVGCSVPVGAGKACLLTDDQKAVTNACRLFGPCWGNLSNDKQLAIARCHQCLSAVRSLLGYKLATGNRIRVINVTNACRLFGPCWVQGCTPSRGCGCRVTNACRLFGPCWGSGTEGNHRPKSVTNACRLFGPCWGGEV